MLEMASARGYAESLMGSSCTIRAIGSGRIVDPETGAVTPAVGATVYSGPCRVRPGSGQATTTVNAGGAELFTFDYLVSIPFAEADVLEGQRVTIDASPDPALVGREVEIQHVHRGETITARRLFCREVA